jgi:hypothetical protein
VRESRLGTHPDRDPDKNGDEFIKVTDAIEALEGIFSPDRESLNSPKRLTRYEATAEFRTELEAFRAEFRAELAAYRAECRVELERALEREARRIDERFARLEGRSTGLSAGIGLERNGVFGAGVGGGEHGVELPGAGARGGAPDSGSRADTGAARAGAGGTAI